MKKDSKKICILGPVTTPSYFGGVAVFDTEMGVAFQNLGWDVLLLTNQKDAEITDNVKCITNAHALQEMIQSFAPDYILASLNYGKYFYSLKGSFKNIYFLHGYFVRNYYGFVKSIIMSKYQKGLSKKANFIFSNSYFTATINEDFFDIHSDAVLHLAASHDFINNIKNDIVRKPHTIFFAGRFVLVKKVIKLVKAMKYVQEKGVNYELLLVGDGEQRKEIEILIQSNNLNVQLIGKVDHSEIQKYYHSSEVFVSLNESEPFGITFVEALLCGCKIVCPHTGGQVEFLKNYPQAFFVNQSDPKDIAEKICRAFQMRAEPRITQKDIDYFSYVRVANEMINYLGNKDYGS